MRGKDLILKEYTSRTMLRTEWLLTEASITKISKRKDEEKRKLPYVFKSSIEPFLQRRKKDAMREERKLSFLCYLSSSSQYHRQVDGIIPI